MTTDQTTIAGGVAMGAVAVFLAEAGLNAADLGYAALGTGLGTASTRSLPRIQAALMFLGLTVVSALMARWCAQAYLPDHALASRGLAAGFGFVSYGIRLQLLRSLPEIWQAVMRRFGVQPAAADKPAGDGK